MLYPSYAVPKLLPVGLPHACTEALPPCLARVPVLQVSVAAKSLCWWVLSVANLLRVDKECALKLARIREGEDRLANTNAYIRK